MVPLQNISGISTGSSQIIVPSSTQSNSVLVIACACASLSTISGITDNGGSSWSLKTAVSNSPIQGQLWNAFPASGITSIIITYSATTPNATTIFREYGPISAFDQQVSANGTSATENSGSTGTLAVASELCIGWCGIQSALNTAVVGPGFVNFSQNSGVSFNLAIEDRTTNSFAAQTATFTSVSNKWVCGIAAYKMSFSSVVSSATCTWIM